MSASVKRKELSKSMQSWEQETGMSASWFLNRVPIDVLPLDRFDRPSNHLRSPCLHEGMSLLRGLISNHMAGIASKFSAEDVVEMVKHPDDLSPTQISFIRELINHCSPRILKCLAHSTGRSIYEWARIMGICEINNRPLAEWINSYDPEYEVSWYLKRIW